MWITVWIGKVNTEVQVKKIAKPREEQRNGSSPMSGVNTERESSWVRAMFIHEGKEVELKSDWFHGFV